MSHDPSAFQFNEPSPASSVDPAHVKCFRCGAVVAKEDAEFRFQAKGHVCGDCVVAEQKAWLVRLATTVLGFLVILVAFIVGYMGSQFLWGKVVLFIAFWGSVIFGFANRNRWK